MQKTQIVQSKLEYHCDVIALCLCAEFLWKFEIIMLMSVRTFYPSVEMKCTLGVAVCRCSGSRVLLILPFKRRLTV